jgi:hypothetical protein
MFKDAKDYKDRRRGRSYIRWINMGDFDNREQMRCSAVVIGRTGLRSQFSQSLPNHRSAQVLGGPASPNGP